MQVDLPEGNSAGELEPHYDHPRDPEKKDVIPGQQQTGRVVGAKVLAIVEPPQSGEGPHGGTEQRLQHVGLLYQARRAAVRTLNVRRARYGDLFAVFAVPCGNAVAPPELPRNAPVANVAHPFEID